MSTYTGDATITDFITAAGTRTGSSGTTVLYTVPAGSFAEVQFISASTSGFSSGSPSASVSAGGVTFFSTTTNGGESFLSLNLGQETWLNEGEAVSISLTVFTTSEVVNGSFRIKEYNKP